MLKLQTSIEFQSEELTQFNEISSTFDPIIEVNSFEYTQDIYSIWAQVLEDMEEIVEVGGVYLDRCLLVLWVSLLLKISISLGGSLLILNAIQTLLNQNFTLKNSLTSGLSSNISFVNEVLEYNLVQGSLGLCHRIEDDSTGISYGGYYYFDETHGVV